MDVPTNDSNDTSLREPLLSSDDRVENEGETTAESSADGSTSTSSNSKDVVFPRWLLCRGRSSPRPSMNHNVALSLLLSVVYGLADSLWSGTVMAAYLKRLGREKNGPVGDVEAVSGLASLFSALPVGYFADKMGRDKVISAGGALIVITAIVHASLLEWIGTDEEALNNDDHKRQLSFVLFAGVMALWGVGGGVINGPSQALYADSTPAGRRSVYYMYLFACYMISSCLGPLVSIVLFQTLGDEWDLVHLRTVLYVGLALEGSAAFIMFFFDDNKSLDEDEEIQQASSGPNASGDPNDAPEKVDEEIAATATSDEGGIQPTEEEEDCDDALQKRRKLIPIILCLQSCVFALGSGMTVKFFPLFFKEEVGMSPSQVQIIYVLVPITMVLFSGVGEKISSTGFGRVQTMILLNSLGVSCLFAMVFAKKYLDSHPLILVPVYVLRTALMNSTYPLNESILMDFVPKNERARWKSLDSVVSFGWCGSAALGGWLTDKYDYTFTFLITAIIQSVGVFCFFALVPLVPRKEQELANAADPSADDVVEGGTGR
mmetsp:Transcript_2307/g.4932  ORF Transcript_2307/g.4932 Transcript_2307/m.4932 type:complete len:547 (-) Transcript_2307:50-1690(-)